MKKLKIEAGKFYRTRDGRKAGIYRTDVNNPGQSIHGYVELHGTECIRSWYSGGRYLSTMEHDRDLIEEWQEPLDFDWDCLPNWADKFIAMYKNGTWCAYSNEPKQGNSGFFYNYSAIIIPKEYQPKNFTGDWTDSVFKNPNLD